MFFLDAFSAPVKVCIRARNNTRIIVHVPLFTMEQVVEWASNIRDEAYERGLEGLDEARRTEARLMYPPIQPDLQDVRRRIHTPEGIHHVLLHTMPGAACFEAIEVPPTPAPVSSQKKDQPQPMRLPSYKEGKKLDPLTNQEVDEILKCNSMVALAEVALDVSGAYQVKPQPTQDAGGNDSPLVESASDEPSPSPETGGTNSSSSTPSIPASTTAA